MSEKLSFPPVDEQLAHLKRGAVDLVDEAQLRSKLERSARDGRRLVVKAGFDPSSPDLHLGHSVLLRKMKHFQDLGHQAVFLIGKFTGMIGDPTGRKTTRPQLTAEQIDENALTYQKQVFRILDAEKTRVVFNDTWLSALGAAGIVRLAGRYTLARMMERDDFRTRYAAGQPIHLHELLYPLLQAYDSIPLEADVELGGHDQIFNLLVGRDLMRDAGLEPQVVLTVPLLVGLDGTEKMSKSLGNAIAFEDTPREIFGKTMSIPDSLVWDWYLLVTDLPEAEIAQRKTGVAAGTLHPKKVKQDLAHRLVAAFHGTAAADEAQAEFDRIFAGGGVPDEMPELTLAGARQLGKLIAEAGLAESNAEARRLLQQGAVLVDGEKASDPLLSLAVRPEPYLLKVGKRRFARIRLE